MMFSAFLINTRNARFYTLSYCQLFIASLAAKWI